jgi:hypothetical protein
MKLSYKFYTFFLFCLAVSCKKDKEEPTVSPAPDNGIVKVKNFNKVDIDGNIYLNVHYTPQSTGEVKIVSEKYRTSVKVESLNGELIINADENLPLSSQIIVDISVPTLVGLRLENNQQSVITWDTDLNIQSVEIVTEASSELEIRNFKAANFSSRQETGSLLTISGGTVISTPSVFSGDIIEIDKNTIVVDNKILVKGDKIESNQSGSPASYTVYGNAVSYPFINSGMFTAEGNARLSAENFPVKNLDIKLSGNSNAKVWCYNFLTGKGEGNSLLSYKGTPAVNYSVSDNAAIHQLQ